MGQRQIAAQNPSNESLRFEVAAVTPNNSGSGEARVLPIPRPGGEFRVVNTPLRELVKRAFDIEDYGLTAPGWLSDRRFDVRAKVPSGQPVTPAEVNQMLKVLLLERFHLKVHREQKRVSGYELTVVTEGKLKPSDPALAGGRSRGPNLIAGHGMSLAELTTALAAVLGRPVVDATHVSGGFEVRLLWHPDDAEAALASTRAGLDAGSMPSLFTALQEQLGLRLKAASVAIEAVVVDNMNQIPDEN